MDCIATELTINLFTLKHPLGKFRPGPMSLAKTAKPDDSYRVINLTKVINAHYQTMHIPERKLKTLLAAALIIDCYPHNFPFKKHKVGLF